MCQVASANIFLLCVVRVESVQLPPLGATPAVLDNLLSAQTVKRALLQGEEGACLTYKQYNPLMSVPGVHQKGTPGTIRTTVTMGIPQRCCASAHIARGCEGPESTYIAASSGPGVHAYGGARGSNGSLNLLPQQCLNTVSYKIISFPRHSLLIPRQIVPPQMIPSRRGGTVV